MGGVLASLPFVSTAAGAPVTAIESGQIYRIESVHSGKVLDVEDWSTANGGNIQQWGWGGGVNQQWRVESVGGGAYRLVSLHSGKVLDVQGESQANGANVQQWDWYGTDNQRFYIDHQGGGEFFIMPIHSEKVLDVEGKSTANGANVQQWLWYNTANQRWRFHPVGSGSGYPGDPGNLDGRGWRETWADDFSSGSINPSVYTNQIGNGQAYGLDGWGNNELQYYSTDNTWVENERLVIEAREEQVTDQYGTYNYTSGKLITANKLTMQYGRVDIRAKLPTDQGMWPALWMLGENIGQVPWPNCGELDIMELVGFDPDTVHGSIHGPGYSGGNSVTGAYSLPSGIFSDRFHVFSIVWDSDQIIWYVDGIEYFRTSRGYVENERNSEWVIDHPFHFLFNVAVGGNWPGPPDASTTFPQRMELDYIRLFEQV
jgi:beta-glucanase (GH16 family)